MTREEIEAQLRDLEEHGLIVVGSFVRKVMAAEYARGVRECFELAREQVDIGGERPIYRFNYNTADAVLEALKEGKTNV